MTRTAAGIFFILLFCLGAGPCGTDTELGLILGSDAGLDAGSAEVWPAGSAEGGSSDGPDSPPPVDASPAAVGPCSAIAGGVTPGFACGGLSSAVQHQERMCTFEGDGGEVSCKCASQGLNTWTWQCGAPGCPETRS
jgi:hypothetical protein